MLITEVKRKIDTDIVLHKLLNDEFQKNTKTLPKEKFVAFLGDQLSEYVAYEIYLIHHEEYRTAEKNKKILDYLHNHFINYFLTLKNTTKEELEKEWNNTITIIREEQNKCKIEKQEGIVKEFLIERQRDHL